MHIRTTTDPISLRDVPQPESHPCLYDGDGENGLEIYFENEENRTAYLALKPEEGKALRGDDSEEYVANG